MNILFISPGLTTEDRYGKALGKVGPRTEPLGLAYLAAAIREKRSDYIEILDAVALNYTSLDLENHLKKKEWDVVGVMMLTPMYPRTIETVKIIKKICPKTKILVGGPHPTIFPKETLENNKEIDIAVVGEGERTIVELLDSIEKKKSLEKIKGICYREKNKVKVNTPRDFVMNIDELPIPARDLLNLKLYRPAPTYYRRLPSYVMLTSRGCPFRCVYCSKISGRIYRHHSVERVIKEMRILIEKYGAKEIIFRDDTFTINKKHVKELCEEIIRQGLHKKIKWTCMTRVNLVDYELLKLMKKAGCWSMHYGLESGVQRLLDLIQKDITLVEIKKAIKWTRKVGIDIKGFFMLGLPSETMEESLQTINFAKNCGADWIQVTITVPYPGTKLYELAQKDGTLKSLKWENYQTWAGWSDKELVYVPKGRDAEEIKRLQKRAMREFYFRLGFVLRQIFNGSLFYNFGMYVNGGMALLKSKFSK